MATEVKIRMSTEHNDKDIMVDVVDKTAGCTETHRVTDGENVVLTVSDIQALQIYEVKKETEDDKTDPA